MATVQLSDLVYGASFDNYTVQESTRVNAFVQAGVMVRDAAIDAKANADGFLHNMPTWKRVANDEPNASSDSPSDVAVPKKLGTANSIARKLMRNQGWSAADLATALIAQDPLEVIAAQVGGYWAGVNQTTLLKICQGILADNIANDSGDMIVNIASDANSAVTDAEMFGVNVVVDAQQTMGDAKGGFSAIAVHSAIHARMQKLGALIDQFDPETGRLLYQTFLGMRVIMDDDMPVLQGTYRKTYTSIMFASGAFRQGLSLPKTPTAVEREEAQGNGEGIETLWNRRHEIIHPVGFSVAGVQISSVVTPTYAQLAAAAQWDRVYDRKLIPMAFIRTNG